MSGRRLRGWVLAILLGAAVGAVAATVAAPPVGTHEQAYRDAAIIVRGDIVAYAAASGATLRVTEVVRGDADVGTRYRLDGSAGFGFLAERPRDVVVFVRQRAQDRLQLSQAPTLGGLIWSEPGALAAIARASADPAAALTAADARERLAGAWFRAAAGAKSGTPAADQRAAMIEAAVWGLENGSPSTHQTAVETLAALGIRLDALGIPYHPFYTPAAKHDAAVRLRAWAASPR